MVLLAGYLVFFVFSGFLFSALLLISGLLVVVLFDDWLLLYVDCFTTGIGLVVSCWWFSF